MAVKIGLCESAVIGTRRSHTSQVGALENHRRPSSVVPGGLPFDELDVILGHVATRVGGAAVHRRHRSKRLWLCEGLGEGPRRLASRQGNASEGFEQCAYES